MKILQFKLTYFLGSNPPIKILFFLVFSLFSIHFINAQTTQTSKTSVNFAIEKTAPKVGDVITNKSLASYCSSSGNTAYYTSITLVQFNTINNSSTKLLGGYSNYTSQTTDVIAGNSYSLTVNLNTDGPSYWVYAKAWIDWNQDGDFDDLGEEFILGSTKNSTNGVTSLSPLSITIPTNALSGNTRIRISGRWNNYPTSCETGFDGEVEDYTINILPSITTGTISPTSYCAGTTISIPYTIIGTFSAGNVFTAQLSNASGSFAAPVTIGTLTSIAAGTITGTIPNNTIAGTGYRIRVISSNPVVIGSVNTSNLMVNTIPSAPLVNSITQPTCTVGTGSVVLNGLPSGNWTLTRSPGAITTNGTGTSTTISGLSPGTYTYSVIGSNNGTGLNAEYFNNMTLSGTPVLTRTDATVNFDWGTGNPGSPINSDNFSVRWSGQLLPLYSQNYTFTTRSDDGIRLWVNGTQIINNWTNHAATNNTGTINLVAGVKYDIVLEYYENTGDAVAQLSWSSASQTLQIIPQSQLYSASSCNSLASANVVINAQPVTPTASTVGVITQPTCTTSTGSVVLNGLPATGTWTINPGAIAGTGTNTTILGLAAGTYNYTVTNASGCTSIASANVVINAQPVTPTTPTIGTITQPTCATGSVVLNGLPSGNWTINPGAITGSTTSKTITGLVAGTYNYTVTNAAGCTSIASVNVIINSQPPINTWNGSISTDWNNAGNWCTGVPNITNNLDVVIPSASSTPNSPILSYGNFGYVENMLLDSGSILTVEDNYLFVKSILKLNGKIDLNTESQLVQGNVSTFDSASTGSIEIDQQGTYDNFKYNYWGSPVNTTGTTYTVAGVLRDGSFPSSIKIINFGSAYTHADTKVIPTTGISIKLSTYWMYKFTNKAAGDYNAWTAVGKDGVLKVGEGFTLKGSNSTFTEQNYTFVGKPNNGDINLTIDAGKQYLIGNPYPSALDARDFIQDNISVANGGYRESNIIDGNLYFWDHFGGGTHFLKSYEGGYSIYNLSGGTKAVSTDARIKVTSNESTKSSQRFIPVAQGFFVTGLESSEIHFRNCQRIFKKENATVSQFLRNTETAKTTKSEIAIEDTYPRIYLKYSSPTGFHRQLLVAFIPTTTDSLDIGYEAINGEKFSEDMSWKIGNTKLVIQAVPTLDNERILPLEVKVATTGVVKIGIDLLENITADTEIFLKDNLSGIKYDIKTAPFEVNLEPGIYTNRFELVFKTPKLLVNENDYLDESIVNIYLNNPDNTIFINYDKSIEVKEISIYNILGQQIYFLNKGFENQLIKIPFNVQSGVYIVNVTTDKETVSKKIIKF